MQRDQLLGFSAVAVLLLTIGHRITTAEAQPAPPPPNAPPSSARPFNSTPAAQLAEAQAQLDKMDATRSTIRRMLEIARSQRDVVKTLCLNDKLNQADVALRSARERRQSLEIAVNRNDADSANHEYTILGVLVQRTAQLSAEANLCIGKEAEYVGDSAIKSTIDPDIPREDPSEYPNDPIIVEPPVCSSCFL